MRERRPNGNGDDHRRWSERPICGNREINASSGLGRLQQVSSWYESQSPGPGAASGLGGLRGGGGEANVGNKGVDQEGGGALNALAEL